MSEAAAEKTEKEPAAAAGGGSKKLLLIIMLVLNLALGGGLAYVVISSKSAAELAAKQAHGKKAAHGDGEEGHEEGAEEEEEEEEEEEKHDKHGGKFGPLLEVGSFIANLSTPAGATARYAKVSLHVEALNEEAKTRVEGALVPIKSEALLMLSSAKPEDLTGQDKIMALSAELLKRCNKLVGKKSIKHVYFSELVVQ